jgi:precorrin-2 dehydrogenase / sirohydrochlorin ferrochelatase
MIEGERLTALVVGGGAVGTRKVIGLLDAGADVRVVAPSITAELEAAASSHESLQIIRAAYDRGQLGGAMLVIAATNDAALNARIASDARGLLVNVVTAPELGNCSTPAIHRAGQLVVAVSAGGVPRAAARIRDRIAAELDDRYAAAIDSLAALRRALLDNGHRERWTEASTALIDDDFCEQVESGHVVDRAAEWR